MSAYVITVENNSGSNVVGVYFTEKDAKSAAATYTDTDAATFKKKLVKKDNTDAKKLMYVEDSKDESRRSVFVSNVDCILPAAPVTKRAKKDKNAPKKGLTAFMIFSNERRAEMKSKHPEETFGGIGRRLGEAWKALSAKDKTTYTKKAQADKARYQKELDAYTQSTATVAPSVSA
jgi:hypothetical protein